MRLHGRLWRHRRRHERRHESSGELILRLVNTGFLSAKYELTEKTERLLAHDTSDDYVYWGEGVDARRAWAIVNGESLTMAVMGGPFYVDDSVDPA